MSTKVMTRQNEKEQKQNQDNGTDWYVIGNRNSIDVVRNSASVRSVLL